MNHAFGTWSTGEAPLDALRDRFGDGVTWRWEPQGVSATYFCEAWTIVVHTWPELFVATIDVWADDADALASELAASLGWRVVERSTVPRGATAKPRAVGA